MEKWKIEEVARVLNEWNPLGEAAEKMKDLDSYGTEAIDIIAIWPIGRQKVALNPRQRSAPFEQETPSYAVFMKRQPQSREVERCMPHYTEKQGQYLAFIYYYTKIHGRPPSEAELQRYFGVTAPTVHQMVLSLERSRLIERTAGQARSIRLLLLRHELPDLE